MCVQITILIIYPETFQAKLQRFWEVFSRGVPINYVFLHYCETNVHRGPSVDHGLVECQNILRILPE